MQFILTQFRERNREAPLSENSQTRPTAWVGDFVINLSIYENVQFAPIYDLILSVPRVRIAIVKKKGKLNE